MFDKEFLKTLLLVPFLIGLATFIPDCTRRENACKGKLVHVVDCTHPLPGYCATTESYEECHDN